MTYVVSREDQGQRCDNRPRAWEETLEHAAQRCSEITGCSEPELELESIAIRVELDTPLNELFEVIRQAVSELEGQGEKSDRIAGQLLGGMGKFCRETGCL